MRRTLAGIFDRAGPAASSRLNDALAPNVASTLALGPLCVAFSGPSPMCSAPLCLFDGFLDNASDLARALGLANRVAGPREFECEELLSAGYRRWGAELVSRLRGDFLVLIWDRERQEGLIARDQLGVRCVYLHDSLGRLHFASEIGNLIALLPARPQPDSASVAHWIAVSNRPGPDTLFAGVRRLNPGSMLVLGRDGAREHGYWAPRFAEPRQVPRAQLAGEVRTAIDQAVGRRLARDAPTGVLMSGGLDSASVAAVASERAPGHVAAYAGLFPEHPAVDESSLIVELRDKLALSGMNAEVRSGGLLASVFESLAAWDVPPRSWGDFWTLPLLRRAASDGMPIVLGGDGGDELFAPRVYLLADRVRARRPRAALALALELPGAGERPPRRQVAGVLASRGLVGALPYHPHDALWRIRARRQAPAWMRRQSARMLIETDDPLAWKRLDGPRWWAHATHGLTRGVEEAGVFEDHRRRAQLAGLQARHPLFDLDLVELVLRHPPEASLDRHLNRPLLRASMAGRVPDTVRLRPAKAWFDSLIVDCLADADRAAIRHLLTDRRAELRAYVDQDAMQRDLFDANPCPSEQPFRWMHQVWRLLTVECWLRAEAGSAQEQLPAGLQASDARVVMRRAS